MDDDVQHWLKALGLGRYAGRFTDNRITFANLADLSEDDLRELGVTAIGDRKSLLRAIARLSRPEAAPVAAAGLAEAPAGTESVVVERRQLTIMFCDMVGSTILSDQLDPEELRDVLNRYLQTATAVVEQYGGSVGQRQGDGLLIYFGWPRAHEDDAERAVRAALDVTRTVLDIRLPTPLATRIGINTGLVVVGETAFGRAVNIAARLQSIAEPNSVLVGPETRRLVSHLFDFEDLGEQKLRGIDTPVRAHRVIQLRRPVTRFEGTHPEPLTHMVGRESELNLLLKRWHQAAEGEGQLVLLSGPPGIGKSRLVRELENRIGFDNHAVFAYQGSPFRTDSAFYPLIEHIERAAGLTARDGNDQRLEKLEAGLRRSGANIETDLPIIAELLSIATEGRYADPALTPQQLRNRIVATVVGWIRRAAEQAPVLVLVEDVHWLDPSTLELIDEIVHQLARLPAMIIMTYRPTFQPRWSSNANATQLSLNRLVERDAVETIAGIVGTINIPSDLVSRIAERAEGVPLFLEELTQSTLETLRHQESAIDVVLARGSEDIVIPTTLRDSLMARLDQFPQGRQLAQIAAVIDREFSYDMVAAVSGLSDRQLEATLSRMVSADILHPVGGTQHRRFAFKHALLRDAAYETLSLAKRRKTHRTIAAVLEEQYPAAVAARPELVAHHLQHATEYHPATRWWLMAGRRATARSANMEAITHLSHALECLEHLAETPERTRQELEVRLAMGIPLIAVRGYFADETRKVFERARELCLKLDNPPEQFQALFGLWGHSWIGGRNDRAALLAKEILAKSAQQQDPIPAIVAHRVMGSTMFTAGDFAGASKHFDRTIKLSEQVPTPHLSEQYMIEPRFAAMLLGAWCNWFRGYPDQAITRANDALALAISLSHPYSVAFSHYVISAIRLQRGEPAVALDHAENSLELSVDQRFNLYELYARFSCGCALGELGRFDEAIDQMRRAITDASESGLGFMRSMMQGWLAHVYARAGRTGAAMTTLDRALAATDDATGRTWQAELVRLRARLCFDHNIAGTDEIVEQLKASLVIARRQKARSWELRAASDLAEIYHVGGADSDARQVLGPVVKWFREGHDTADLTRARQVLDRL